MGKRLKVISDPSRDRGHEAGAKVIFMQPSEAELGSILFQRQMHWVHSAKASQKAFDKLDKLQNEVLLSEPDGGNYRHIRDSVLLGDIFISGCDLVNHTYLLYRHLSHWIISTVHVWPDNSQEDKATMAHYESRSIDYEAPLNYVVKGILKREDLLKHKGYSFITGEWKDIRHALNHPNHENVYSADPDKWDKVPLAWFVSGRFRNEFKSIIEFHNELLKEWKKILPSYKRPGTIKITHRGATSLRKPQIKKSRQELA